MSLPPELLIQIFGFDKGDKWLITLLSVCHQWRNIALSEPSLWTDILVRLATPPDFLRAHVTHSGSRPLKVEIIANLAEMKTASCRDLLYIVLKEYRRIDYLAIQGEPAFDGDTTVRRGGWPDVVVDALSGDREWPLLHTLRLVDRFSAGTLHVQIVASSIRCLLLDGVFVTDWTSIGLGSSLQELTLANSGGVLDFDILRGWAGLRRLALGSVQLSGDPFYLIRTDITTPHFLNLLDLVFTDTMIAPSAFMLLLGSCPRLETLIAKAQFIDGAYQPYARIHLPNLRVGGLSWTGRLPTADLRELCHAFAGASIEDLRLCGVGRVPSLVPLVGPALSHLVLQDVRCDANDILRAMWGCPQLQHLELINVDICHIARAGDVTVGSHDSNLLCDLREAHFVDIRPVHAQQKFPILRMFLAFVDVQITPVISIQGVAITAGDAEKLLASLSNFSPWSVDVHTDAPNEALIMFSITTVVLPGGSTPNVSRYFGINRMQGIFDAVAWSITDSIFSHIHTLTLDILVTLEVFRAMSPVAGLPQLVHLVIAASSSSQRDFGSVLTSALAHHAGVKIFCPLLCDIELADRSRDVDTHGELIQLPPAYVPKRMAEQFLALFLSKGPVELKLHNAVLISEYHP